MQAIGGVEGNIEILAIPNKYKESLEDLIDSLNEESQDWPGPNDKGSCRAPRFKGNSRGL